MVLLKSRDIIRHQGNIYEFLGDITINESYALTSADRLLSAPNAYSALTLNQKAIEGINEPVLYFLIDMISLTVPTASFTYLYQFIFGRKKDLEMNFNSNLRKALSFVINGTTYQLDNGGWFYRDFRYAWTQTNYNVRTFEGEERKLISSNEEMLVGVHTVAGGTPALTFEVSGKALRFLRSED